LKKGGIEELVDPRLEGAYDVTQLKIFAFAASLCIRASSTWRPTMTEVPTLHFFLLFRFPSFTTICKLWKLLIKFHKLEKSTNRVYLMKSLENALFYFVVFLE